MVEIKETKETKSPDVARLVDESMTRLQDMERRLHAVQGHLSGLANLANALYQAQPTVGLGAPMQSLLYQASPTQGLGAAMPWNASEIPSTPSAAFPLSGASALPFFGTSAYGASAGAASSGFGPAAMGASAVGTRATTPWIGSFGAQTPGAVGGQGLSARDFEKLPAVARVPEVNFVDAGEKYVVKIELPGVKKEDLDITVSEHIITVEAEARHEVGQGTVLVGEVVPTVYRRTISLPTSVNTAKGKANLKDGFLTLEIPKKEPTEGPRRLDVAYG